MLGVKNRIKKQQLNLFNNLYKNKIRIMQYCRIVLSNAIRNCQKHQLYRKILANK